jgi:hypothetical protein
MAKPGKGSRALPDARGEATAASTGDAAVVSTNKGFEVRDDGARVRKLSKTIMGHQGPISEIVLRRPTYRDFMDLGDPKTFIVIEGGWVPQHDLQLIERYVERLSGIQSLLLVQCDYTDGIALRDAVLSFF